MYPNDGPIFNSNRVGKIISKRFINASLKLSSLSSCNLKTLVLKDHKIGILTYLSLPSKPLINETGQTH